MRKPFLAPAASTNIDVLGYRVLGMWYYHRDSDGLQWGPFTPGPLTKLLNLGVLDARSLIRSDGDETWHSYYAKPQPEHWHASIEEDLDAKIAESDRIVADLQRHTERKRNGSYLPWAEWMHPVITCGCSTAIR